MGYHYCPGKVDIMYEERSLMGREELAEAGKESPKTFKRLLYNFFINKPSKVGEKDGILRIDISGMEDGDIQDRFEEYVKEELDMSDNFDPGDDDWRRILPFEK